MQPQDNAPARLPPARPAGPGLPAQAAGVPVLDARRGAGVVSRVVPAFEAVVAAPRVAELVQAVVLPVRRVGAERRLAVRHRQRPHVVVEVAIDRLAHVAGLASRARLAGPADAGAAVPVAEDVIAEKDPGATGRRGK